MHKIGKEMYSLMERLFPICRSITGNGNRKTLNIIKEHIPVEVKEVPSGTKVFDWVVPDEWNIKDAYIKNEKGDRIVDFHESNLHVVNYSIPFEGKLRLNELNKYLYSLPDQPDLIPYVTSYYKRHWGFCLSDNHRKQLKEGVYEVKIDSTIKPGHLTYADLIIKGQTEKEILFSTYFCHPSMANNELSGPVVATFLAKYLLQCRNNYYTYRFVFAPETIGAITYLSKHIDYLKKKVIAGYVLSCLALSGKYSYIKSRGENNIVDKLTEHVLEYSESDYNIYEFIDGRSDEGIYCYPGVDLPIGSLIRTLYGDYPEYHTSGDNLELISHEALQHSYEKYLQCIDILENNHTYKNKITCIPQLGKRGLWPSTSKKKDDSMISTLKIRNFLNYCDGSHDLLEISEKIKCPAWELFSIANKLMDHDLIEKL